MLYNSINIAISKAIGVYTCVRTCDLDVLRP